MRILLEKKNRFQNSSWDHIQSFCKALRSEGRVPEMPVNDQQANAPHHLVVGGGPESTAIGDVSM